jgi:pimeloyl-ACP methyl ester carboxylesterase
MIANGMTNMSEGKSRKASTCLNFSIRLTWKSTNNSIAPGKLIQHPNLLLAISKLRVPALFVYGERDIRPSWPIEQVAQLLPFARFELIKGAEHVIWFSHQNELRRLLREFVN